MTNERCDRVSWDLGDPKVMNRYLMEDVDLVRELDGGRRGLDKVEIEKGQETVR